jgi:predicted neuraminidase
MTVLIAALTLWTAWPALFRTQSVPTRFAIPLPLLSTNVAPRLTSALINQAEPARVHAASIAALPDGRLLSVWFGGQREGGTDVKIYAADYQPEQNLWSPQRLLATPEQTTADTGRFTRKLGNPVVFVTPKGELWVIYVGVALGGWATSQLNLLRSQDLGASWLPAKRLITSPFLNLSTLVKAYPVFFENGDIGLPVYYEMAGKLGELLTLTPEGEVRNITRMDHGARSLQPVVLVESPTRAIALMRDGDGRPPHRVWRTETEDAGRSWSPLVSTDLPNPNSALTALRLEDGRLLAVANDTEDERLRLSLLSSVDDGWSWRVIHRFEDKQRFLDHLPDKTVFRALLADDLKRLGNTPPLATVAQNAERNLCRPTCGWQYDYPYLIRSADGDFHLVYTWNRSFIRHLRFNRVWLEEKL